MTSSPPAVSIPAGLTRAIRIHAASDGNHVAFIGTPRMAIIVFDNGVTLKVPYTTRDEARTVLLLLLSVPNHFNQNSDVSRALARGDTALVCSLLWNRERKNSPDVDVPVGMA